MLNKSHPHKVSNRRAVWDSRSGWKKYKKLIVQGEGGWNSREDVEKN